MTGRLPDFLYVGADKAGSTWLYRIVADHPEIYVPIAKDLYYFDRHYDRGLAWYAEYFSPGQSARTCGEFSHDYLYSATALERIRCALPSVKLLISLRNPLARSVSNYLFLWRHGMVTEAVAAAIEEYPEIIDRSLYHEHVRRCIGMFGAPNVLVIPIEQMWMAPEQWLPVLWQFLGVEADVVPAQARKRILAARAPRWPLLSRIVKTSALGLRTIGLESMVGRIKRSDWIHRILYRDMDTRVKENVTRQIQSQWGTVLEEEAAWLEKFLTQYMRSPLYNHIRSGNASGEHIVQ